MAATRSRRIGVLAVFVLAVLLIPLQLVIKVSMGREPYPALTQPAFAYAANALPGTDAVASVEADVEVTFVDTSVVTFKADELIAWTAGISQTTILKEAFIDERPGTDSIAWLGARISDLQAGATSARVRLYTVLTDAHTLEQVGRTMTDESTVTFAEAP